MTNDSNISRRRLLAGAVGAAVALTTNSFADTAVAAPGRPADAPVLAKPDIDRMMTELSNAGRWGKDDQIGTVNLITQAKRKQALALAREGTVVSLAHTQSTEKAADNTQPLIHKMNGTFPPGPDGGASDSYTISYHGYYYTHMDALCHMFYGGHAYNGYLPAEIVSADGATKCDIAAFQKGIVTRGVLMDIPRLKNVPYLESSTPVYPEDLDAWEKQAHIKVSSGDMLFLRVGRWKRRAEKGATPQSVTPGLHASSVRWLKQRDVAVMASDAVSDVLPSQVDGVSLPVHKLVIAALGTPIFDNCDLEELSETANRLRRWEFMVTAAPMVIPGGTGSPINPLAIF